MPHTAPSTVSRLLHPLDVQAFLRDHASQRAVHVPGPDARHSDVFGWPALDALLNAAPAPHPALRVYTEAHGTVAPATAAQAIATMRQGAAVVVNEADRYHPQLGHLADALTAELDAPCRVNVYATSPSAPGFPLHADTHDVFVLHIAGRKQWQVTGPSMVDPLYHPSLLPAEPPADPTPYLDAELTPGDTLYIPRGHWHRAAAVDGPSLHLTVAVFRTTGMDLLSFVAESLYADRTWRRAVPLAVGPTLRPQGTSPAEHTHLGDLARAMQQALSDPTLLERYRTAQLAKATPRQAFRVSAHLGHSTPDGPWAGPRCIARTELHDDGVVVHIPGRDLWLPTAVSPALPRVFSGQPFVVRDLCADAPDLSIETAERIVADLVAEGIVHPST